MQKDVQVNNKQKIILAATKLFGEKGVEATSLADIAKTVGISKGTLYYYYSSKNDLIFDITEEHMGNLTDGIFELIEGDLTNVTIEGMLRLLIEKILNSDTRTRLHIYLIQQILAGNEQLKERFIRTYNEWFTMIEEGFRMITKEDKDIAPLARGLVSIIDGLIIQKSIGIVDIPLDELLEKIPKVLED